eukprot:Gregarina_sp_Pseudo_9__5469@NODE_694_length_2355_cov_56_609240_g656_i0_p1_GENE_NODE_694_length_2355_cov_56_609240_g656_i0NODE_694_length_2355_cov_56_609240_g656_i0_p1_ORF_typecomplete_len458_score45_46_NODE_694_length_2355_cov_56_609240_g656_i09522325
MKTWKSVDVTTAASSLSPERIPLSKKSFIKVASKRTTLSAQHLYSIKWPPVNKEDAWKRHLYLVSFVVRALLALETGVCSILTIVFARAQHPDLLVITTVVAGLCSSVFLAAGSVADYGVWATAPDYLQVDTHRADPYCIYGQGYFQSKCARLHGAQVFFNRIISTIIRAIVIAFAVPGTQWRWSICEGNTTISSITNVPDDHFTKCSSPLVYTMQMYTFAAGISGCLTPFITEVLWPSKIWSLYSLVGAVRLTIGAISTSMSIRFSEGIWRFSLGKDDDYNQLPKNIKDEASFLFYMLLLNGVMSGLSLTFGGIYSQFCVWKRSRFHLGCDIIVNIVVCCLLIAAYIGSRLVWTIQTFFCQYQTLFPENSNPIATDICVSIRARYSQNYLLALLQTSIAFSVVQTIMAITMNWSKRWKPAEWRLAHKLEVMDRSTTRDLTFDCCIPCPRRCPSASP